MKVTIKRMKRQATDWEKIFVKYISDKGFLSKILKELLKFNNKICKDAQHCLPLGNCKLKQQ